MFSDKIHKALSMTIDDKIEEYFENKQKEEKDPARKIDLK